MGFVNLPSVDDIQQQKDPKQQMEMLINTLGLLMKELREINGYLGGSNIRAKSIEAEKLLVDELSAITAKMGKLTSGEIYGAYIATKEGSFPRIEFSSVGDLLAAYTDAFRSISIFTLEGPNVPAIQFWDQALNRTVYMYFAPASNGFVLISQGNINISASTGNVIISSPSGNVMINGVSFASKADKSSVNGTVYVSTTPGGPANTPITFSNGVRTS